MRTIADVYLDTLKNFDAGRIAETYVTHLKVPKKTVAKVYVDTMKRLT